MSTRSPAPGLSSHPGAGRGRVIRVVVTSTTSSPARRRTEPYRPVMRHVATGPALRRLAGRWSAITTSRAVVRRRPHGTPRTVRKAARSRISSPRAETDTSTASRTDARKSRLESPGVAVPFKLPPCARSVPRPDRRQSPGFARGSLPVVDRGGVWWLHREETDLALRRVRLCNRLHLVVDSTGLSIVGEGEWAAAKHGGRGKRGWKSSISASIGQATLLPCLDRRDG